MIKQAGSVMLMVVLLMTLLLVLCARMWRTTAYVIDIAIKKQEHVQNKWATRGILQCGVAACQQQFEAVHKNTTQQGGSVTVPMPSYQLAIPQLQHYTPTLTFATQGDAAISICAELKDGKRTICTQSCVVSRPA